jgi:hypothetical protein
MYKLNLENVQKYILGGKADFIIRDINNEDHINFKVKKDVKNDRVYYVTYKSIDWLYLGKIEIYINSKKDEKDFVNFKALTTGKITEDVKLKCEIFYKFILWIYHKETLPINIEVMYSGKCSVCNRKLTDPKYIEIGIGKHCLENM